MTAATLRSIAAHLDHAATDQDHCARMLANNRDRALHVAQAAQLRAWRDDLRSEADARALAAVDIPTASTPGDDAIAT